MKRILFITGLLGVMGMLASPVRSIIGGRNTVLAKGENLPYDAEVEYLESTGTQWIDTGFCFSDDGSIPNNIAFAIRFMVFSRNGRAFYINQRFPGVSVIIGCGDVANRAVTGWLCSVQVEASASSPVNNVRSAHMDWDALTVDGIEYPYETHNQNCPVLPLYLFAETGGSGLVGLFSARIYSFWACGANGEIDLIPVRFTNELGVSEGAMYDRVSGQLFRNAGTGAFLFGQDKH